MADNNSVNIPRAENSSQLLMLEVDVQFNYTGKKKLTVGATMEIHYAQSN